MVPTNDPRTLERAMAAEYQILFAPWVHASSLVWCGFGLWVLIQPSFLVGPFGPLIVQRENAGKFGITPALMDRIVALAKVRENCVHYDDRIARIGGSASLLTGLVGIFTQIDPAIIASVACVIAAWTMALYLASTNRTDGKYIASLDVRHPTQVVSWWLFVALAVEAFAELSVRDAASVTVGCGTLICAIALWWSANIPGIVFGDDVTLEQHVDARFRLSRLMAIVLVPGGLAQIWLLTGYASANVMDTPVFIARMTVQITLLVPYIFWLVGTIKCNHDLRRAATGS
jgi:hypothetical protein